MYERYFGLRELPFDLTANPRYLYLTPSHREALSNLQYGITRRRGVTLLIGDAGTGKTTVVRAALESDSLRSASCVYLNNPSLTRAEFIEFLARAFALSDRATTSKTTMLFELEQLLRNRAAQGLVTALVVDEAQAMPMEVLEEIRLLANIETPTDKLLPVVLAGQLNLADRLNDPALKQLNQRVALRCELRPLDLRETSAYIAGRIRIAGGDSSKLFTREAVELIHRCSQGIPRTISVICDNALVSAFAADQRPIGRELVQAVCNDFDLKPQGPPPAPPLERGRVAPPGRERSAAADRTTNRSKALATGDSMFSVFTRRRRFSFF